MARRERAGKAHNLQNPNAPPGVRRSGRSPETISTVASLSLIKAQDVDAIDLPAEEVENEVADD